MSEKTPRRFGFTQFRFVVAGILLLVDEVRDLSDKIDEIHRILESKEKKTEKSTQKRTKTVVHRQHVNEKVMKLLTKHHLKVWTSEDLAGEIGCSGAAVRQTKTWNAYCKTRENEKQNHRLPKGHKNKRGDMEAYSD